MSVTVWYCVVMKWFDRVFVRRVMLLFLVECFALTVAHRDGRTSWVVRLQGSSRVTRGHMPPAGEAPPIF